MQRAPFSPTMTVREARDAYLAENGFTVAAYDEKWTDASFFGIEFKVPNTKRHRDAIMLHDLHHVVTGFGTDLVGEGEISAWEARRGLSSLGLYVGGIVASGTLMGLLLGPRRTLRAWRRSLSFEGLRPSSSPSLRLLRFAPKSSTRESLFPLCRERDFAYRYEALLSMTVGELRRQLGVPQRGIATAPRKLHAYAPLPLA